MSEFKKLFQAKRILAMILAVAMVVTMLPQTTYAATVTDSVLEQSEEAETSEVADTEESSVAADAATEEATVAETTPAETTEAETTSVEAESAETNTEAAEPSSVESTTDDADTQPVADGEESAVMQAEIVVNDDSLEYYAENYCNSLEYDSTENKVVTTYGGEESNPFSGLLSFIKVPSNSNSYTVGAEIVTVDTEAGNATNCALEEQLTFKWQVKGADGSYADMAATDVPVNAGEYKLVISLDPTLATAESKEINFVIKKKEINVVVDSQFDSTPESGITVKEVKEALTEAVKVGVNEDDGFVSYANYMKSLTFTVRESLGTEALADETVLKKGNDYSVDVVAELADEYTANYEIAQCDVIILRITELKETALTITNNLIAQEKDITRTYTGEAVAEPTATGDAPEISVEVTVVGETDETTGEDKVLPVEYAQLTKTWFDADGIEMEAAPVDAGVYYLELKYTDAEGIYKESSDRVKVVVEPVTIILKPSLSVTEYFAGMSANDVTVNATYTLQNADGTSFGSYDPATFWGVSYNNPEVPQSYAPVFKLQMGRTVADEDGKTTTTWTDVDDVIEAATGVDEKDDKATISYRVVFSGTKALYVNGYATNELDINATDVNSAEKNYVVDTTAAVIEANAVEVKVNASANATIDVTDMLISTMKEESINTEDKVYSKVYDGIQLYEDRAAYKKAVLKDAEGKKVSGEEAYFTYTWHTFSIVDSVDKDGNKIKKPVLNHDDDVWTEYDINPSNAGMYALQVSYTDPEHKYTAKPVCLYFRIDKQLLKVIPEGTLEAYDGTSIGDFTEYKTADINYKVYKIPGNDETLTNDKLEEIPELGKENIENVLVSEYGEEYCYADIYYLDWFVMQGDNMDAEAAEFSRVYGGNFKLGVPYKLGVRIKVYDTDDVYWVPYSIHYNYTDNYKVIVDGSTEYKYTCETLPVAVKPMGATELEIKVDSSKLTTTEKVYDGKPVDVSGDIANGLITVTKKNTDDIVPVTGEGAIALTYRWYKSNSEVQQAVNAGEYVLKVRFDGDDNYQLTDWVEVGTFTINPRELTITPVLKNPIVAGWYMGDASEKAQLFDNTKVEFTGYIEEDAEAFAITEITNSGVTVKSKALSATAYVKKADSDNNYDGYLRTGEEYVATYSVGSIDEECLKDKDAGNYTITVMPVEFQTNQRGNSQIYKVDDGDYAVGSTRLAATYGDQTVEVVPVEGIPYCYGVQLGEEYVEGNYFAFKITRPAEFNAESGYSVINNAIYKNNIEKAGGYVLAEGSNYIVVVFDAAAPESGDNVRNFEILWEEGYVEKFTVDFTNAELEANLKEAVAPKKLAFNGVNKKMVVGEKQQLDVKITKNLIDDVICLNYEVVAGEDVVSVDSSGHVTALKKGTATISVFPVKYDVNGNETKIDFKAVTTKISVVDVTAPKGLKVYAYDDSVEVRYTAPSDGYRREIYILEGNVKPAAFESKIAEMNQNVFDGVRVECVDESERDEKTEQVIYTVYGLNPNTDYTIYVRNVSGIRTTADGSSVVSSAAGAVKKFKTTKVQADYLSLEFKEDQPVTWNKEKGRYEVSLSKKSVKATAFGEFLYKPENAAADSNDKVWYELPLTAEQQKTFTNPKLSFYALDSTSCMEEKTNTYKQKIGDWYYSPSTIAKVDKKGNIKLNGVGTVYIMVYDSISGLSDWFELYIDSDVTKITSKTMTVKVGEPQGIWKSLTFYNEKTKLKLSRYPSIQTEIVSGEGIEIKDSFVVATQANKTAELKVYLKDYPEIATTVKVSTKGINPVKKLKAENVMDTSCVLTFTHSVNREDVGNVGEFAYRIEVKDARNALVESKLVNADEMLPDYDDYIDYIKNLEKGIYKYSYQVEGLVHKSSYKISVTPVYGTETGKTATVNVKTTDLPAYSYDLLEKDDVNDGMCIYCPNTRDNIENGYFTSGNSYTFKASANYTADGRATDTLTWKSSDKKVATIKGNPGTYSATFKALKPGTTTIEVSSKLRKGVVARWIVRVKAVGAVASPESGDFEYLHFDKYYTGAVEELTEANNVRVVSGNGDYDYTWVKFTAPAYGKYTFNVIGGDTYNSCYYYRGKESEKKYISWTSGTKYCKDGSRWASWLLNEGETVYLRVAGSFTMEVAESEKYSKLTTTAAVNSTDSAFLIFTAPEDNYYTFEASKADQTAKFTFDGYTVTRTLYNEKNDFENNDYNNAAFSLSKGDVVTISLNNASENYNVTVSSRKAEVLTTAGVEVSGLKAGDVKWYTFTAAAAGNYTFKSTDATKAIKAEFYDDMKDVTGESLKRGETATGEGAVDNSNNFVDTKWLDKDETVVLKVYTESKEEVSANVTVTYATVDAVSLNEAKEISVPKNGATWVSFTVDEDDAKYSFKVTGEADKTYSVTTKYYKNDVQSEWAYGNEFTSNAVKKDDTIYIKLTTNNTTDDASKVTVLVTKAVATEIALDEAKELKVENGGEYLYTFTAPSTGLYVFQSYVTENAEGTGTHALVANQYETVNDLDSDSWAGSSLYRSNDFYKEQKLKAGETVVFAVCPNNTAVTADGKAATTQAKISVTKATAAALPEGEITLVKDNKGAAQWYVFRAAADDTYKIKAEKVSEAGTADVYYGDALNATDSSLSLGSETSEKMQAGDKLYFKVVNADTAETKLKLTVNGTESVVTEIPAEAFEIAGGETNIYKFTVKKAGRYRLDFSSETEGVKATVQYAYNYSSEYYSTATTGKEFACSTVGQTYYFKVSTDNTDTAKKASVKLSMKEVTVTALENELTSTLKSNETQWFAYTVPATGRYIFTATTGEKNTDFRGVSYYENITEDYSEGALSEVSETWLTKGTVVYIRLYNSATDEVAVKLTAKAIAPTEITAGTTEIQLKNGETKWFKFTADADTYYTIKEELAKDMYVEAYYYLNTDSNKWDNITAYYEEEVALDKGETLLIKMTREDSVETESLTAKLTITKEEMLTLKEKEDLTITTKSGDKQYISFTPAKTAYYAFGVKEVPEGVDITVGGDEVYRLSDDNRYTVVECQIAEEVRFDVDTEFTAETADTTKSYKMYVEEVVPTEITTDAAVDVTVTRYQKAWFTFEAPEDGRYTFTTDNTTLNMQYARWTSEYISDDYYGYATRGTMPFEYPMQEGDKVTVAVYYDTYKTASEEKVPDSASFKVNVTKVVPTAIQGDETTVELAAYDHAWYSYTAANAGEYKFTCESGKAYVYKTMAASSSSSSTQLLAAGETVYVRVYNNGSEKKNVKVTVAKNEAMTLGLDSSVEVAFTEEEIENGITTKYLAFTAAKAGYYVFTNEKGSADNIYLTYDGNTLYSVGSYERFMTSGKTVYICVTSNSATSVTLKAANGKTKFTYEVISLDKAVVADLDAGEKAYYEFTAPKTGNYEFYSTYGESNGDSYASLWNSNMTKELKYDDDGDNDEDDLNFRIEYRLEKGQTVYLEVEELGNDDPINCNVFVELAD